MIGNSTSVLLGGGVKVMTTSNRGFNPEEVADRALDKIIAVGSDLLQTFFRSYNSSSQRYKC